MNVILISDQLEGTELGIDLFFSQALDGAFLAQSISDQIGNRADLQTMLARKPLELRATRHRAIVVHDLDDDGGGL